MEIKNENKIEKSLKNLCDYGDNAIRYFRLTRYIYIRGGGFYIDLNPRRSIELETLLAYDDARARAFDSKDEYDTYISDIAQPKLPWKTKEKYILIIKKLVDEIRKHKKRLKEEPVEIKKIQKMQLAHLSRYISELRAYRRQLQEQENAIASQTTEKVKTYISNLKDIFEQDDRSIFLEKFSALGLHALDDALKIQPNYPVGDDNEPTFTAPANIPDIECFYKQFNAICEVTMLTTRSQWYNEGQPVMRHLRDFEQKHENKPCYCLFIAPKLHRDTLNTFWTAIRYEYEGQPQKIIPLSISYFISVLEVLLKLKTKNKFLRHTDILCLYNEILKTAGDFDKANEWFENIPQTIRAWGENLIT